MQLIVRDVPPRACWALEQSGVHPLLARLYAARGVREATEINPALNQLLPPDGLRGVQQAATLLADALAADQRLCIVADYDCDGATACAVGLRGLRMLGARQVDFLVPDRVVDGYGLTPAIAQRVHAQGADVLITVDNGIASVEGVAAARELGMQVLVTDHHLPGDALPAADALVNPNQPECGFASKCMAGVGVMFYVLLALRAELRRRGHWADAQAPRLDTLLPLVALGTVADVVRLDANNRRLVAQGLRRIRAGAMPAGMHALFQVAQRDWRKASTFDLGFALGPRLNAAGRLADMRLGIVCLSTDDALQADTLAQQLDAINRERRSLEDGMREQAMAMALPESQNEQAGAAICVLGEDFHEGVIGIVASRLKDRLHRPVFVFAPNAAADRTEQLKGSGRSIAGFHLRDALDLIAKRHPGIVLQFGGHAMAAGCTIARARFDDFRRAFAEIGSEWLDAATLQRRMETDGPLQPEWKQIALAHMLQQEVWGQGFAAPVFAQEMDVISQRIVGERHLKLVLRHDRQRLDAIWFGRTDPLPARAHLAFRLDVNEWQGQQSLQLVIEGMAA